MLQGPHHFSILSNRTDTKLSPTESESQREEKEYSVTEVCVCMLHVLFNDCPL